MALKFEPKIFASASGFHGIFRSKSNARFSNLAHDCLDFTGWLFNDFCLPGDF